MGPATRFDEWGIRAAEQLETSVGAWIALASFKRLFVAPSPIRERAILGALRCALQLGDAMEVDHAATAWSKVDPRYPTDEPLQMAMRELARGAPTSARTVARCEDVRRRSARSAYAAARIFGAAEGSAGPSEESMLLEAQARARAEGAHDVAAAAAARRLELLEIEAERRPVAPYRREAIAIAADVTLEGAPRGVSLVVARAQLLAPGRYVRASALSTLGDVVRGGGDLGRAAARAIGLHVDAMGMRLTAIEAERALHGLSGVPEARVRDAAIARTRAVMALAARDANAQAEAARAAARGDVGAEELAVRARALAAGSPMPSHGQARFGDPFITLAALGLDALGAMASGKPEGARAALVAAGVRIGPAEPVPAPLWSALFAALVAKGDLREIAARLGGLLVCRAAGEPPQGFLALGEALAAAGAADASREALDLAARGREPGAREALARAAAVAAWKAYDAGDTAKARDLLVSARDAAR